MPGPGLVLRQRYRLDSEIGRGAMGRVFRATDLELLRPVAVKILAERIGAAVSERSGMRERGGIGEGGDTPAGTTPERGATPVRGSGDDMRLRFLRAARAVAALNHPNIVAIYDVGEDHGFPFFVMELVNGPNLGQTPPHDLEQVIEFACQICAALEHAHTNKIVHRDLKPANVLLSGVTVKLADLGLALPAKGSRISHAGTIVGTAAYMAPEQALGKTVDGRADLYALGVMLYELTTGRVPFPGDDPLATISQHLHAPVVPPRVLRPDLPRTIETVILRLLAKDPAQRFATAAETATALRNALAESDEALEEESGSAVALLDALSRGRLVARSAELGEARELWRRAREGRGHCLLLSGEPGSGKTRLAREVIVQATLDGAVVLSGACYEYEAATPYLPFVEALRRWVREQGYRRFWESSFQRLDALLEELKTKEKDEAKLREVFGDSAPQIAKLAPEIEALLGPFPARDE